MKDFIKTNFELIYRITFIIVSFIGIIIHFDINDKTTIHTNLVFYPFKVIYSVSWLCAFCLLNIFQKKMSVQGL